MTISSAILLGIVQGVAEFLPISSSGHLAILQNLFALSAGEEHMFFDVLLHLGTLISICVCYWGDIVGMVREVFIVLRGGRRADGTPVQGQLSSARLFLMIVVGTLPLFLVLPINDSVEQLYYITPFIGVALLLTGCILFVSDRMTPGKKTERNMRFRDALIIGLCQCVATIPGLSRSGTTITAGIATGLDRKFAMKYSFLLSLPAVLGANLLSLIKAIGEEGIDTSLIPAYLIGMLFAMLSGIAAILLMKLIAKKSKFGWFAYYCWGAGVLTIILGLIF
ncbi:MAG TPA: undecaprenyl-diphosphate phosphatase [Candidatus Scatomorpha pullistercoris]|uniref:Undecaprenyl-diphosphatase n=1 Tax=Candidatus Scatomorpha pullistercoris TaxID=2840929 RepID=A0A9D1G3K4_9FIRM|nr:undecaprenyl-diphosphate phosphatase [Candidatus Scatomorpha pullistercoris]